MTRRRFVAQTSVCDYLFYEMFRGGLLPAPLCNTDGGNSPPLNGHRLKSVPLSSYISARAFCARAAPIAVFTSLTSSGGGKTAFMPKDSIHNSLVQPVV